jgi:hypothetical protein
MLHVYKAENQKAMDRFISKSMSVTGWEGFMFAQPDCGKIIFPAQFVVVAEPRIKLATIQVLQ